MGIVLDAGALIAVDRRSRPVGALLRVAQREQVHVRTSSAVVAQVWRDGARQADLARVLAGVEVVPLDALAGRRIGTLLARSATTDVVDGHVALLAGAGDTVLTGDVGDLTELLAVRGVQVRLRQV